MTGFERSLARRWAPRAVVGLPYVVAVIVFGLGLSRAWVSDDSLITVRMIDNLLHGHGWRWNVAERVQAFTHPAWAILLTPFMLSGLSWFWALISLSAIATGAALAGVVRLSTGAAWAGTVALVWLGCSRAFLDYSSSGLENPLTGALLVALVLFTSNAGELRAVRRVALLTSLLALTRLDLLLMALPAVLYVSVLALRAGVRWRPLLGALLLGCAPLFLWELFALVYYGFPYPNTAYAKLNTGADRAQILHVGWDYFVFTLTRDPATLLGPAVLGVLGLRLRTSPVATVLIAGAALYDVYVIWIGGDFMSGRFFTAPLVLVVATFASPHVRAASIGAVGGAALAVTALVASVMTPYLPLEPYTWDPVDQRAGQLPNLGIARALEVGADNLANTMSQVGHEWRAHAEAAPPVPGGRPFDFRHAYAVGFLGLTAGPEVHIIDHLALTEPFLARLPAGHDPIYRAGHFERMGQWSSPVSVSTECPLEYEVCRFWRDYDRSVRTGRCALDDENLCQYWSTLRQVTEGELFSRARWHAILQLNTGQLEHLIDRQRYRNATLEYPGQR